MGGSGCGPAGLLRCGWVSCLGGGLDGHGVAECFELFDEAAGAVLEGVAAGEPVGAEFAERDAVAGDVVVGDQDVVAGGSDRFCVAAAAADLPVVGGEIGVLAAGCGAGRPQPDPPSSRTQRRRPDRPERCLRVLAAG